jgi:hypothetical protein
LNDPSLVEKHNELLQRQLAHHKIPEKLADLQKTVFLNGWSPADQVTYEKLDHIITEAMLYDEKKSSKKYTGRFFWSPDLIKSVQAERYWKLWLKTTKGITVTPQALSRTQEAAGLAPPSSPPTLAMVVQELSNAKRTRKALQKQHLTLRESYLTRLLTSLVLKACHRIEDPKYEQQLQQRIKEATKCLIKKERRRAM